MKEQLEQIVALQKQKGMLEQRLRMLSSGQMVEELNQWDDPDLTEQSKILGDLREKLAAYKLIGLVMLLSLIPFHQSYRVGTNKFESA